MNGDFNRSSNISSAPPRLIEERPVPHPSRRRALSAVKPTRPSGSGSRVCPRSGQHPGRHHPDRWPLRPATKWPRRSPRCRPPRRRSRTIPSPTTPGGVLRASKDDPVPARPSKGSNCVGLPAGGEQPCPPRRRQTEHRCGPQTPRPSLPPALKVAGATRCGTPALAGHDRWSEQRTSGRCSKRPDRRADLAADPYRAGGDAGAVG